MKDREIDEILRQAGQAPPVDPALLDRIAGAIQPTMRPVRPLPPRWILTAGLFAICGAIALAGAARLGFAGIQKLGLGRSLPIFAVLAILTWLAATAWTAAMIPGSRRLTSPTALLGAACVVLLGVFALLFRDYTTEDFLHQGLACLGAGLLHAVPAGLAGWLLLRRGFAVNPIAAGLSAGILAGLCGVSMLELHCPNFEAFHIMLWHTAVIPISGAAGALLGWRFGR